MSCDFKTSTVFPSRLVSQTSCCEKCPSSKGRMDTGRAKQHETIKTARWGLFYYLVLCHVHWVGQALDHAGRWQTIGSLRHNIKACQFSLFKDLSLFCWNTLLAGTGINTLIRFLLTSKDLSLNVLRLFMVYKCNNKRVWLLQDVDQWLIFLLVQVKVPLLHDWYHPPLYYLLNLTKGEFSVILDWKGQHRHGK